MLARVSMMMAAGAVLLFGVIEGTADAQPSSPSRPPAVIPAGPPPPTLPDTISRDDQGHATVRAVRVTTPMRIDGKLDEAVYASVLRDWLETDSLRALGGKFPPISVVKT